MGHTLEGFGASGNGRGMITYQQRAEVFCPRETVSLPGRMIQHRQVVGTGDQ